MLGGTIQITNVHEVLETVERVLKKIRDYKALQQIIRIELTVTQERSNSTSTMLENNNRKTGRTKRGEKTTRTMDKHEMILCRRLTLSC